MIQVGTVVSEIHKYLGHVPEGRERVDEWYCVPTKRWVEDEGSRYWREVKIRYGRSWKKEKRDCDNFAIGFMYHMRLAHQLSKSEDGELSIGFLHYKANNDIITPGYHAANIILSYDTDTSSLSIGIYEPQIEAFVYATPEERQSCDFYYI